MGYTYGVMEADNPDGTSFSTGYLRQWRFKDNDECPTCSQAIDYNFKEHKIDKLESKLNEVSNAIIGVKKEAGIVEDTIREVTKTL